MTEHEFYRIEGGTHEDNNRVQAAMNWLISEKADRIGEQILRDAYKLHKKPLIIKITDEHNNSYSDLMGEHTIEVTTKDLKGNLLAINLARELVHSSQPNYGQRALDIMSLVLTKYDEVVAQISEQPKVSRKNFDKLVDFRMAFNEKAKDLLSGNSVYIRYQNEVEKPAEKVARKIARIIGEKNYKGKTSSSRQDVEFDVNFTLFIKSQRGKTHTR